MGIFAAVVAGRYGRAMFAEFGARATAHELSLDLLTCQRAAIATGDDHYLDFVVSGGAVTSYRMMRRTATGDEPVDAAKQVPADVTVTITAPGDEMNFRFEGQADAAYQVDVVGSQQSFHIDVVPINGAIRLTQT